MKNYYGKWTQQEEENKIGKCNNEGKDKCKRFEKWITIRIDQIKRSKKKKAW